MRKAITYAYGHDVVLVAAAADDPVPGRAREPARAQRQGPRRHGGDGRRHARELGRLRQRRLARRLRHLQRRRHRAARHLRRLPGEPHDDRARLRPVPRDAGRLERLCLPVGHLDGDAADRRHRGARAGGEPGAEGAPRYPDHRSQHGHRAIVRPGLGHPGRGGRSAPCEGGAMRRRGDSQLLLANVLRWRKRLPA